MFAFTQPPAAGLCQAGAASLVPQHSPELAACQLVCLQSAGPLVGQPLLSPSRATGSCRLMGGSSKLCSRDAFVDCHRGPQRLSPPPVEKQRPRQPTKRLQSYTASEWQARESNHVHFLCAHYGSMWLPFALLFILPVHAPNPARPHAQGGGSYRSIGKFARLCTSYRLSLLTTVPNSSLWELRKHCGMGWLGSGGKG